MKLRVAYSPCPNDTFVFHGLAQGLVDIPDALREPAAAGSGPVGRAPEIEITLQDVETLNRQAFDGLHDVTKLSFHAWLYLRDRYQLLRVGAALGRGCGPLVVARGPLARGELAAGRIAVPGEYTTAHLLLRLWMPEAVERVFVPYDRIMDQVVAGEVTAGVIIHEGRFVYRGKGLTCLADLGEWWEAQTGMPIPLGCVAAKTTLGEARIAGCEALIERSLRRALADPSASRDYVRQHAQEMDDEVIRQHIATYVNGFSLELGAEGHAAIAALEERARAAGVIR